MKTKRLPLKIAIGVSGLLVLAACVTASVLTRRHLSAELAELKWRREVDELTTTLAVPEEALHCDDDAQQHMRDLWRGYLEERGIKRVLRDYEVRDLTKGGRRDKQSRNAATAYYGYSTTELRSIAPGHGNRFPSAANERCSILARELEDYGKEFATSLVERRDVFETRVRPLLYHLMKQRVVDHNYRGLGVAHMLLAYGERSDEITAALTQYIERVKDSETKRAAELVRTYGLNVPVDVDEILRPK